MEDIINEYANRYINDSTKTKEGYCQRCLNEKWRGASHKKTLYEYKHPKQIMYICHSHVGCMEIGKELATNIKPINDLEKRKHEKELEQLIEEGVKLLQKNGIHPN